MKWLYDFIGGRKMFLIYSGVVAVTVLAAFGKIPADEAVQWITILATSGAATVAVEDGMRARSALPDKAGKKPHS